MGGVKVFSATCTTIVNMYVKALKGARRCAMARAFARASPVWTVGSLDSVVTMFSRSVIVLWNTSTNRCCWCADSTVQYLHALRGREER